MKLQLHNSLKVALKVQRLIEVSKDACVGVRTLNNGREQGLTAIVYGDKKTTNISWCECRNSDSIMVYVGRPNEAWEDGIPSERAYRAATSFTYGSYEKAARFIQAAIKHAAS